MTQIHPNYVLVTQPELSPEIPLLSSLSTTTRSRFMRLLEAIHSDKAQLVENAERIQVEYPGKSVAQSEANRIQEGKPPEDVLLEEIEEIKRGPSSVVVNKKNDKEWLQGTYTMGEQLGEGSFGTVYAVKSGEKEGAVKTVMISDFRTDEVRAMMELDGSEWFPSLDLFRLKVSMYMEYIKNALSLDTVFREKIMRRLRASDPHLARCVAICIFHSLLSAVQEMHDKNWTHGDLHRGNVLLSKDNVSLKVLDFGEARRLITNDVFDHKGLRKDHLDSINLFTRLYVGKVFFYEFLDLEKLCKPLDMAYKLSNDEKAEVLDKLSNDEKAELLDNLSNDEKAELLDIVRMNYDVCKDENNAGYGDAKLVLKDLEKKMSNRDKMKEILQHAARKMFPEYHQEIEREQGQIPRNMQPEFELVRTKQQHLEAANVRLREKAGDVRNSLRDLHLPEEKYYQLKSLPGEELSLRDYVSIRLYEAVKPLQTEVDQLRMTGRAQDDQIAASASELHELRKRLEVEHQAHAELRVQHQKMTLQLAETKTQVKTDDYKVENYDKVKYERDNLEHDQLDVHRKLAVLEGAHTNIQKERDDFFKEMHEEEAECRATEDVPQELMDSLSNINL